MLAPELELQNLPTRPTLGDAVQVRAVRRAAGLADLHPRAVAADNLAVVAPPQPGVYDVPTRISKGVRGPSRFRQTHSSTMSVSASQMQPPTSVVVTAGWPSGWLAKPFPWLSKDIKTRPLPLSSKKVLPYFETSTVAGSGVVAPTDAAALPGSAHRLSLGDGAAADCCRYDGKG